MVLNVCTRDKTGYVQGGQNKDNIIIVVKEKYITFIKGITKVKVFIRLQLKLPNKLMPKKREKKNKQINIVCDLYFSSH